MYGEVVGFARNGQGMPASLNTSRCESVESVFAMCWKNVYGEAIALGSASARRESEMTYQVREIPHGMRREQTQADEVRERARGDVNTGCPKMDIWGATHVALRARGHPSHSSDAEKSRRKARLQGKRATCSLRARKASARRSQEAWRAALLASGGDAAGGSGTRARTR